MWWCGKANTTTSLVAARLVATCVATSLCGSNAEGITARPHKLGPHGGRKRRRRLAATYVATSPPEFPAAA